MFKMRELQLNIYCLKSLHNPNIIKPMIRAKMAHNVSAIGAVAGSLRPLRLWRVIRSMAPHFQVPMPGRQRQNTIYFFHKLIIFCLYYFYRGSFLHIPYIKKISLINWANMNQFKLLSIIINILMNISYHAWICNKNSKLINKYMDSIIIDWLTTRPAHLYKLT